MSGFQFIRCEGYARKGKAKGKGDGKRSLRAIAQEADREHGAHPHVPNAKPPAYRADLPFQSFVEAAAAVESAVDQSKVSHSGKKRAVRADAQIALGVVASHPTPCAEVTTQEQRDEIEAWAADVIEFLQAEFGQDAVLAACMHWDEGHPHLHVLIGSTEPTDDFVGPNKAEAARRAAQGADRSKAGKKAGNDAYKRELQRFQDAYHDAVAAPHAQARFGPGRKRMSRADWQRQQNEAERTAVAMRAADQAEADAKVIREEARSSAGATLAAAQLAERKAAAKRQRVDAAAQKVVEARKEVKATQKEAEAMRTRYAAAETLAGRFRAFLGRVFGGPLYRDAEKRAEALRKRYKRRVAEATRSVEAAQEKASAVASELRSERETLRGFDAVREQMSELYQVAPLALMQDLERELREVVALPASGAANRFTAMAEFRVRLEEERQRHSSREGSPDLEVQEPKI